MTLWYPDSDASSHVIGNLNQLVSTKGYDGFTRVMVANGAQMKVTHTRFSRLSDGTHGFALNDIFVIPLASKKLLLIYRFCLDNDVHMEFDHQRV